MSSNLNNNVENAGDDLKSARKYVDRLLNDGPEEPVDEAANSYEMQLPEWYDEALFKRAQQYYHDNIFAMFAGKLIGLIAVLAVPSIMRVLTFTDGSASPLTAYRRYLQTIFHTMSWYDEELKPGTRSWRSLAAVRKRHVGVSLKASKSPKSGIISQKDMALTQFGFVGFILLRPQMLGVQVTRANHEALVHFWRVLGHMLGIRDEYNLLTDSWATTRPRLQLILSEIYRPLLSRSTDEFHTMAGYLIEGLWCFDPFLCTGAYVYFAKMVAGCSDYWYYGSDPDRLLCGADADRDGGSAAAADREQMSWWTRTMLGMFVSLHGFALNFAPIRWYMNQQIYLSAAIIKWFPFLAIWAFGARRAYVRILGE